VNAFVKSIEFGIAGFRLSYWVMDRNSGRHDLDATFRTSTHFTSALLVKEWRTWLEDFEGPAKMPAVLLSRSGDADAMFLMAENEAQALDWYVSLSRQLVEI
jgi:hypothetical protein